MIESVVYGGVEMNFIPSPKMDFVAGGMIFPSVRSWKARFFKEGVVVERGVKARTTVAFEEAVFGSGYFRSMCRCLSFCTLEYL